MGYSVTEADSELIEAMPTKTTLEIYKGVTFEALCDRGYEANGGVYRTIIQNPTLPVTVHTNRGRGGALPAADTNSGDTVKFVRDQQYTVNVEIDYEDEEQSPVATLERYRAKTTQEVSLAIDANIAAYISSYAFANEQKLTVGTGSANVLTRSAVGGYEKGTGERLIENSVDRVSEHFALNGVTTGGAYGGQPGELWIVLPMQLFFLLRRDLQARNLAWDDLTDSLFDNRIRQTEAYKGRLYGVNIIGTTSLTAPSSGNWKAYAGTRDAVALAIDGPRQSFVNEPRYHPSLKWQLVQDGYYGRTMVNPELLVEVTYTTVAS